MSTPAPSPLDELDVHQKVDRYLGALRMCRSHELKGTHSPAWDNTRLTTAAALAAEGILWTGETPSAGAPDYGRFTRKHLDGYNPMPAVGMRLQTVVDGLTPLDIDQERANQGSPFDTLETDHIETALQRLFVDATRDQTVALWSLISADACEHWLMQDSADDALYRLERFALESFPTWDKGYGPVSSGDVPSSSLQT